MPSATRLEGHFFHQFIFQFQSLNFDYRVLSHAPEPHLIFFEEPKRGAQIVH
jgi:hypothetical protein